MKSKWMILILLWNKMKLQQLANDNNPINFQWTQSSSAVHFSSFVKLLNSDKHHNRVVLLLLTKTKHISITYNKIHVN